MRRCLGSYVQWSSRLDFCPISSGEVYYVDHFREKFLHSSGIDDKDQPLSFAAEQSSAYIAHPWPRSNSLYPHARPARRPVTEVGIIRRPTSPTPRPRPGVRPSRGCYPGPSAAVTFGIRTLASMNGADDID